MSSRSEEQDDQECLTKGDKQPAIDYEVHERTQQRWGTIEMISLGDVILQVTRDSPAYPSIGGFQEHAHSNSGDDIGPCTESFVDPGHNLGGYKQRSLL